ncbi:MAG: hypothetical protein WCF84_07845 [Anaerolineae bacterium]
MLTEPKRVKVNPNSEIARLLEEAREHPLVLESNGEIYRIYHEEPENIWANYDPDKVKRTLAETAGSWADLDTDRMIQELYRAREQGSRPETRP